MNYPQQSSVPPEERQREPVSRQPLDGASPQEITDSLARLHRRLLLKRIFSAAAAHASRRQRR
jgi:hypothetical protein